MFQELSSLILSQLSLMKPGVGLIVSYSTLSSLSMGRKTLLITTQEDTTLLARKLWILFLIGSGSWLTNALDFRDSFFSTLLEEELDQVSPPCSWKDYLWTMARNPSLSLLSTLPLRLLLL